MDPSTIEFLQSIVNQLNLYPPTIENVRELAQFANWPPVQREEYVARLKPKVELNPILAWSELERDLISNLLVQTLASTGKLDLMSISNTVQKVYPRRFRLPESNSPICSTSQCEVPSRIPRGKLRGTQLKWQTAPPLTPILERTFLITGQAGFDHGPLRAILDQLGFREIGFEDRINSVGILFFEQAYAYNAKVELRYDPRASALTSRIKSILSSDKQCIANKEDLYFNAMAIVPALGLKYLAPSQHLKDLRTIQPEEVWILKPVGNSACCGAGIEIATTPKELQTHREQILRQYKSGIASKYISYPLLLEGRKCHLRTYLMARGPVNGMAPHFEMFTRAKILTAKKPYFRGDYQNKDIHDSHGDTTDRNWFFPEDLVHCTNTDGSPFDYRWVPELEQQLQAIAEMAGAIMLQKMKTWNYAETNFAYEVFGCDILVDTEKSSPQLVVLEINEKIGNSPTFGENLFGTEISKTWPPEEKPGLFGWNLDPYRSHPMYPNIVAYEQFSNDFWFWVAMTGILPSYYWMDFQSEIGVATSTLIARSPALPFGTPVPLKDPSDFPTVKTYLISGSNGIDHSPLRSILNSNGWREVSIESPGEVGYVCQEQRLILNRRTRKMEVKYDRAAFDVRARVKSLVGPERYQFVDKGQLYFNLVESEIAARYLASTRWAKTMTPTDFVSGQVYIVKPTSESGRNVGGGQDISVVTTWEEFQTAVTSIRVKYKTEPIVSEYILNPWTIQGRKCHFRMFFLMRSPGIAVSGRKVEYGFELWNQGTAMTAAEPFELNHFENKRIHDSHLGSTDRDRFFNLTDPRTDDVEMTLEERLFVYEQMTVIMNAIGVLMRNQITAFPESLAAYEVFGVDFMVRREASPSSLKVVLLEMNDHIGMKSIDSSRLPGYDPSIGPFTERYTQFSTDFWTWVYVKGIAPYFEG